MGLLVFNLNKTLNLENGTYSSAKYALILREEHIHCQLYDSAQKGINLIYLILIILD